MSVTRQTLTFPIRLAMDDATNMDAAEIRLVVKKIDPSFPSGSSNLRLKKYVIQVLGEIQLGVVGIAVKALTTMLIQRQTSPSQTE